MTKDYTKRPNVVKWLPYWQNLVEQNGKEWCARCLQRGHTVKLSRKDRYGLLQALGLSRKA